MARSLLIPMALLTAACACAVKPAYLVSPALSAAADLRVAVLPFDSQAVDISAPDVMRKLAAENLSLRGYAPLPAADVDTKLSALGISEGGQTGGVKPKDIGAALGVDLLCYGEVEDFNFQNLGFVIRKSAALKVKLVSAATGETLYEGSGSGKDIKVYLDRDEATRAFEEQKAIKLADNMMKVLLKREAEKAAWQALDGLPRR